MAPKHIAAVSLIAVLLAGCEDMGPRQSVGTVVGGIAGGVAGAQFGRGDGRLVGAGVGAALGALLGSEIGRQLDERDRMLMERAQFDALETAPSGTVREWRNPDNGRYGQVAPGPAYAVNQYQCRDYTHTVVIEGRREIVRGTACRQPDGTWRPLA